MLIDAFPLFHTLKTKENVEFKREEYLFYLPSGGEFENTIEKKRKN